MAPHAIVNGDSHEEHSRPVNVLVTGFTPFQDLYPVNPSFEIAKALPTTLPTLTTDGRKINIICHEPAIRVCYEEVRDLIPKLHKSYLGTVDLVLHIGMASGRKYYVAELYGHRDGYTKHKDLDLKTLPADDGIRRFPECAPKLRTSLNYEEVLMRWKMSMMDLPETSPGFGADVRRSEDAGHYVCDYTYFSSLAWYGRRSGMLDGGKAQDRPVLFLHVPAESDEETLGRGGVVAMALIKAMVDDWCSSPKNGFI